MSNTDLLLTIDHLRQRQEQRLFPALESWEAAKRHLDDAVALTEARAREFRQTHEDIQRNLDALVLVIGMAKGVGEEIPAQRLIQAQGSQPMRLSSDAARAQIGTHDEEAETALYALDGILRGSSRQLLSAAGD